MRSSQREERLPVGIGTMIVFPRFFTYRVSFIAFFVEFLIHANKFRAYKYVIPFCSTPPVPALALPSLSISDLSYGIDRQLSLLIPVHNSQERVKLEGAVYDPTITFPYIRQPAAILLHILCSTRCNHYNADLSSATHRHRGGCDNAQPRRRRRLRRDGGGAGVCRRHL